eukprot:1732048-Rhodomonas_salina.1
MSRSASEGGRREEREARAKQSGRGLGGREGRMKEEKEGKRGGGGTLGSSTFRQRIVNFQALGSPKFLFNLPGSKGGVGGGGGGENRCLDPSCGGTGCYVSARHPGGTVCCVSTGHGIAQA